MVGVGSHRRLFHHGDVRWCFVSTNTQPTKPLPYLVLIAIFTKVGLAAVANRIHDDASNCRHHSWEHSGGYPGEPLDISGHFQCLVTPKGISMRNNQPDEPFSHSGGPFSFPATGTVLNVDGRDQCTYATHPAGRALLCTRASRFTCNHTVTFWPNDRL